MLDVLSTKMKVDDIDRFEAIAEQQGKTKSGLLRFLVEDYMNSRGTEGGAESTDSSIQAASSGKGLPPEKTDNGSGLSYSTSPSPNKLLPSESPRIVDSVNLNYHDKKVSPAPAPVIIDPPDTANEGDRLDSPLSYKEILPVYQNETDGRPEASNRSSIGKWWLLSLIPPVLWLISHTSIVRDGESRVAEWK